MEYSFEVPVTVYHVEDEDEQRLDTKKSIVDFVVRHLPNATWRDFFPESIGECRIEALKDRMIVRLFTDSLSYSQEESDSVLHWLDDWMKFGYFEGGLSIIGRYYGYPYETIAVHTWDAQLPIVNKTKLVEVKNV